MEVFAVKLSLSLFLLVALSSFAHASSQQEAIVALHAVSHTAKLSNVCPGGASSQDPNTEGRPCVAYEVDELSLNTGYNVYLVVAKGNAGPGIAGVSLGISYNASDMLVGFDLCADLEFPNPVWPNDGGGNTITWDSQTNCQSTEVLLSGVHAIAGSFYIYAYGAGTFSVVDNPNTNVLSVADCSAATSTINGRGSTIGFGPGVMGQNMCIALEPCGCQGGATQRACCCSSSGVIDVGCRATLELCAWVGGNLIGSDCQATCEAGCSAVGTQSRSWGQIKTRPY